MSEKNSITQDLEHLFKKTTEANKIFFSESAKFVKNISSSNIKGEDIFSKQTALFKEALNLFVKLNIQHTSNLIDLGVAVTKRMNQGPGAGRDNTWEEDTGKDVKPAFVLNIAASAGTTASTRFLLDSDKKEPVVCNLKQTEYLLQADPSVIVSFETTFSPQSFELNFGKPQKVEINIAIPPGTQEGVYLANVRVDGFEHTYFSLFLTVTESRDVTQKPASAKTSIKPRKRKSK